MIPAWVSWPGLAMHALVGGVLAGIVLAVPAPWNAVLVCLIAGGLHEQAQTTRTGRYWSDFVPGEPGAPLNGILDVLAFAVPLSVWLVITWLV